MPARPPILNIMSVACAVVVTSLLVRKEVFSATEPAVRRVTVRDSGSSHAVEGWDKLRAIGHRIGPDSAGVHIVEFADFECPYCGKFANQTWRGLRAKFGDRIQLIFRHWPLSYHRFAYPTARAAECAAAQGRFEAFHDSIYSEQDSLGLVAFDAFAKKAGVADISAFVECFKKGGKVPAIEADIAAAVAVGATGTPAVIVDGQLLGFMPDSAESDRMIVSALTRSKLVH